MTARGVLSDIPKKYQRLYQRAMEGKSRKTAMRAACLRCCNWRESDVRRCSDVECPLYAFKPRARILPDISNDSVVCVESTNSENSALATVETQNEAQ
jgi:hypothetical protein